MCLRACSCPCLILFKVFSVPVTPHASSLLSVPSGGVCSFQFWVFTSLMHLKSLLLLWRFIVIVYGWPICWANLLNSLLFFSSMWGNHGYERHCFALMKLWNQEGKESGVIVRRNHNLFDRLQAITIETEDMNVKAGAVFRPGKIVLSLSVWVTCSVLYSWLPVWTSTVPHCSRATVLGNLSLHCKCEEVPVFSKKVRETHVPTGSGSDSMNCQWSILLSYLLCFLTPNSQDSCS